MKNSNLFQRIGWLSAMALTVAAVAASCSQDELVNGTGKDNPVIGFGISAARTENDSLRTRAANSEEESPVILLGQKGADTLYLHTLVEDNTTLPSPEQLQTRGVPVTTNNFGDICHSFNVTAYTPDGAVYMRDIEVGTVSNNVWSPNDGTHYWPDNMELHFYAYAPHDGLFSAEGETQTAAPGSNLKHGMTDGKPNGSLSFTYTVPISSDGTTDAEAQPDIMFAYKACSRTGTTGDAGTVPLEFAHALAAIKFVGKDIAGTTTIQTITLKNLYGAGDCVYTAGENGSFNWKTSGVKKDFCQTFGVELKEVQTDTASITDVNKETTFMMIPQSLDDVEVEVKVKTETGEIVILSGSLSTPQVNAWEAGKIYTYAISTESINWIYVFEVTPEITLAHGAISSTYEVSSYRYWRSDPNKIEPLPWNAEWISGTETDAAGSEPSTTLTPETTIHSFVYEGEGSQSAEYPINVMGAKMHTTYKGDVTLQEAPPKGTADNPYDLSTEGGSIPQSTANCYVVNAPGFYKLPLVYGNAIKDGEPNLGAYNNAAFVDYKNNKINDPYITKSGTPHDCILVWSDGFYMFENVHLDGDHLVFSLNEHFMQQANGIVAVRDENGVIMWSWHIWVTERDVLGTTHYVQDYWTENPNAYSLMQCNLGWVDGKMVYYNQRDFSFKFTQPRSGKEQIMKVVQNGAAFDYKDVGSTYYQWGRKDPLVALRNWNAVKFADCRLHETIDEKYKYKYEVRRVSIGEAIQNPNVYYTLVDNKTTWINSDNEIPRLWDNSDGQDVKKENSVKTIYDPSPRGFKVPIPRAFAVFVNGFTASNKGGTLNGYKDPNEPLKNRYDVYLQKNGTDGMATIPFTATGQRADRNGKLETYNPDGEKAEMGGLWAMYGVYYWTCISHENTNAFSFVLRDDEGSDENDMYTIGMFGAKTMARPVRCIKDE